MKLSKKLLTAVALGITMGSTSCSLTDLEDIHYDYCEQDCSIDHTEVRADDDTDDYWFDCPACGMG